MSRTVWRVVDANGGRLLLVEIASAHSPLLVTVNSITPLLCQTETKRDRITIEQQGGGMFQHS